MFGRQYTDSLKPHNHLADLLMVNCNSQPISVGRLDCYTNKHVYCSLLADKIEIGAGMADLVLEPSDSSADACKDDEKVACV